MLNRCLSRAIRRNQKHQISFIFSFTTLIFPQNMNEILLCVLRKSPLSMILFWKRIGSLRNKKRIEGVPTILKDRIEIKTDQEKAEALG